MKKINQIEPLISEHEVTSISQYLKSGAWLTQFNKTKEFEEKVAQYVGAKYATAVPSGMVAIYLSLLSVGVGKGDKVVVPNYTMIATINAVKWTGAEPVICDVDPESLCIDLDSLDHQEDLKAVIHVSINGRSGDMQNVINYCNHNKIALIEDAAQAMGSKFDNKFLGTFGDLGIYSLTPHKIITTGQGGIIVTNDIKLHEKVESLKDFCRTKPGVDIHTDVGFNFKFTDLQSVIGIEQIKTIDFRVARKKELFNIFNERFKDIHQVTIPETDLTQVTPWANDIIFESVEIKNNIAEHLSTKGIGTRVFYPPLNSQLPYSNFEKGSFPVSESIVVRGLWLPSSVTLSDNDMHFICDEIISYFK